MLSESHDTVACLAAEKRDYFFKNPIFLLGLLFKFSIYNNVSPCFIINFVLHLDLKFHEGEKRINFKIKDDGCF